MFINKNGLLYFFIFSCTLAYCQDKTNQYDAQGKRNGKWIKYFEGTDQKRYEGTFDHGKEIGTFKFYKPKSKAQPVATKTYFKEHDSVQVKFYNKKGSVVSQGMLIGKQREGTWKYFHKNSQQLMMVEHYKNDQLHGEKIIYFPNGKITETQHFSNGELDGENSIYGDNGQLIQFYTYKNGLLSGPSKTYDAEGRLTSEGNYKKGLRDGEWKFYENGKLKETKQYPLEHTSMKGTKNTPD